MVTDFKISARVEAAVGNYRDAKNKTLYNETARFAASSP